MTVNNSTRWTDEMVARLSDLIDKGLSSAQIGRELGTSRCAVQGKANRLGLQLMGIKKKRSDSIKASESIKANDRPIDLTNQRIQQHSIKSSETPIPSLQNRPDGVGKNPVTFEQLKRRVCHWPLTDTLYCGDPIKEGTRMPYCSYHHDRGTKSREANLHPYPHRKWP